MLLIIVLNVISLDTNTFKRPLEEWLSSRENPTVIGLDKDKTQ